MNNNIQILQLIVKYTNALYSDGSLYWSDDPALATPERKAMVIADIKLITDNLDILNKQLV
ncbi:hypothetical protein [Megaira polyxenophila phage MAnkyphage_25.80]|nr:hypothetical protein [Megaira polyxenophila phage MAnkyphage_25.80]